MTIGKATQKAFKKFQKEKKLPVTGLPDQRTLLLIFFSKEKGGGGPRSQ